LDEDVTTGAEIVADIWGRPVVGEVRKG